MGKLNTALGRVCKIVAFAVMLAVILGSTPFSAQVAHAADTEYQLYPSPHSLTYGDGSVTLDRADLIIEKGIDSDTQTRLDEALTQQQTPGVTWKKEELPQSAGLSVLVGIKGSNGAVDKHAAELQQAGKLTISDDLFDHLDSYMLAVIPKALGERDEIIVLGKDTDAAFYGLTSLYHILTQAGDGSVRELTVQDYADVQTRGFIEGYYGFPWSTQNRIDLMTWGGYYKLNAYVYAPKDDPKHNAKWWETYTEEELQTKIAPLAEAGNKSKTRFLYALHPFMSQEKSFLVSDYDEAMNLLKAKYQQVLDSGVRQIAILADDVDAITNWGTGVSGRQDLLIKTVNDLSAWLKEKIKETNEDGSPKYEGLKDTLIFCPPAYFGRGESWYKNLDSNVKVINTGAAVWGFAKHAMFNTFKNNSGRPMFMWMNFPCSDNDRDALHMGNYETFLGTDVQPGDLDGLVMNPMQQSEPSKQGIFMNADFSWNLWKDHDHADQVWEDSFSYIDHNSYQPTDASNALRSISDNMRQMTGGGVTWEARESAPFEADLTAFKSAVASGTVTAEQIEKVAKIYSDLVDAAKVFRTQGATPELVDQMLPWLNAFEDLGTAAKYYLDAYAAMLDGDDDLLVQNYQAGSASYAEYQSANSFPYYNDSDKVARVGKRYLTPIVTAMDQDLSVRAQKILDPNAQAWIFVTNRTDTPEGSVGSVTDGNDNTFVLYKNPNKITLETYIGVTQEEPFDLTSVRFVMGAASGQNYFDNAKLQVTHDGNTWTDVTGAPRATTSPVTYSNLNEQGVLGVRLQSTVNNRRDAWLEVHEIEVNPAASTAPTFSLNNVKVYQGGTGLLTDGDLANSPYWVQPLSGDSTQPGSFVAATFNAPIELKKLTFAQAQGGSGDGITDGVLEVDPDGSGNWQELKQITSDAVQKFDFDQPVTAKALRIRNEQATGKWWKIFEFSPMTAADLADKSVLKEKIAQAEEAKQGDYTSFSLQVLNGALQNAQAVEAKENAKQDAVDAAVDLLQKALDALKPNEGGSTTPPEEPPAVEKSTNFANLNNSIAAKKLLSMGDFSQESWKAYEEALVAAEVVSANADASQEEVDKAWADLWAAMKALVLLEEPQDPEDPTDPGGDPSDDPATPDDPSTVNPGDVDDPRGSSASSSHGTASKNLTAMPNTGSSTVGFAMISILFVGIGGAVLAASRRRAQ